MRDTDIKETPDLERASEIESQAKPLIKSGADVNRRLAKPFARATQEITAPRSHLGNLSARLSGSKSDVASVGLLALALCLVLWSLGFLPPQQLDGLWQAIAAVRSSIQHYYRLLAFLLVSGALAITLYWGRRDGLVGLKRGAFCLSVSLVFSGEMLVLDHDYSLGAFFYLAGAIVLVAAFVIGKDEAGKVLEFSPWSPRNEAAALLLVLATGFFTHFYMLGRVPYGIEGDESSWALRVLAAMNSGTAGLDYPFAQMPTSYWLQSMSYHLFGASIESARLGVALLSLTGTVLFYFAAREMVNIPVALIATFLLGVSLIDIAASRQAHVETYVKVWIMAAVACMLWGYRRHKPPLFFIAGASLALGLMVYDSFALTPFALLAYVFWQLVRNRQRWKEHLVYFGALLLPIIAVAPGVWTYLEGRRVSQVATLTAETGVFLDSVGKIPSLLPRLTDFVFKYAGVTLERLTVQQLNDVLIGRPGPLESAAFAPLLFLGLVIAVRYWHQRHIGFALFWVLVPGLPTSLILGQTFARTYYPFLGGLVILAAIGLWICFSVVQQGFKGRARQGVTAVLLILLGLLGLSNAYVYFNQIWDPPDRYVRREFGDLLRQNAKPGQMIYLPYVPLEEDLNEFEWRYARYSVASVHPGSNPDQLYRSIPYPELLEAISGQRADPEEIKILYDKTIGVPGKRQSVLRAVQRCYPGHTVQEGRFLTVYSISPEVLARSTCSAKVDLKLTSPAMGQTISAANRPEFSWELPEAQVSAFRLVLERRNDQVVWLEAEELPAKGWEPQKHLTGNYNGAGYLADIGSQDNLAEGTLEVRTAGHYTAWARVLRRRADGSPVLLQVADHTMLIGSERTSGWEWQSLGAVDLPAGPVRLSIIRHYDPDPPWQIFIDTIVLSLDSEIDLDGLRQWNSVLDTSTVVSSQTTFRYETPLAEGDYRWRVEVYDGDRIIGWDGSPGYTSRDSYFSVKQTATNAK